MTGRKIFCIGFNKTGTTSLGEYFRLCGLTSCHWPSVVDGIDYEARCAPIWNQPDKVLDQLAPVLDAYQVHSDVPWPGLVAQLAARYPDALFVLSTRAPEAWWSSLEAHWSLGVRQHRLSPYERIQFRPYLDNLNRCFGRQHRSELIQAFLAHEAAVSKLLPPDALLKIGIGEESLVARLARFAGTDPGVHFPAAQSRPAPPVKAARRLLGSISRKYRFGAGW